MLRSFLTQHSPTPPCHLPGSPCPGPSLELLPAEASPGRICPSASVRSKCSCAPREEPARELCCHSPYPHISWSCREQLPGLLSTFQGHLHKLRPGAEGDGGGPAAPWCCQREESYGLEAGGLCTYVRCSRLPRAPFCLPRPLGMAWTPNGCCIS